ncbi:hypothetical protein BGZ70_009570 [Mortierella alpina]|uniref:Uncharacterized protein n=1 Tax=Mortierella alpina TaxID=64518 RepID=A0A9P6JCR9_MORAP|nr:hypothetical protein BGZ70_009570 [Mortierella alpina]
MIINEAAHGALKGEAFQVLTVEYNDLKAEPWILERRDEGVVISTPDKDFVSAIKGEAMLTPFEHKWSFEDAGDDVFKIKVPYEDQVLSWDEDSEKVYVLPAKGGNEQLWRVVRVIHYDRMYRQY